MSKNEQKPGADDVKVEVLMAFQQTPEGEPYSLERKHIPPKLVTVPAGTVVTMPRARAEKWARLKRCKILGKNEAQKETPQ